MASSNSKLGAALMAESIYLGICLEYLIKTSLHYQEVMQLGTAIVLLLFHFPVYCFLITGMLSPHMGCYLGYLIMRTTTNIFLIFFGSCVVVWFEQHGAHHWVYKALVPTAIPLIFFGVSGQVLVIRARRLFWEGSPTGDVYSSAFDRRLTIAEISSQATMRRHRYRKSTAMTRISTSSGGAAVACKSMPEGLDDCAV